MSSINIDFNNPNSNPGFDISNGNTAVGINPSLPAGAVTCNGNDAQLVADGNARWKVVYSQSGGPGNIIANSMTSAQGFTVTYTYPFLLYSLGHHDEDQCSDLLAIYQGVAGGNVEKAWVIWGSTSIGDINLASFNSTTQGYTITSTPTNSQRKIIASPYGGGSTTGGLYADFELCFPWYDTANGLQSGKCFTKLGNVRSALTNVNTGSWSSSYGPVTLGPSAYYNFPTSVAYLDWNKDGKQDKAYGNEAAPAGSITGAGVINVCMGTSSPADITNVATSCKVVLGPSQNAACGMKVVNLGPTTSGGFDSLGISCPTGDGVVYVAPGSTNPPSTTNLATATTATIPPVYKITTTPGQNCGLGNQLINAGKLNSDSLNEIIVAGQCLGNSPQTVFVVVSTATPSDIVVTNSADARVIPIVTTNGVNPNGPTLGGNTNMNQGTFDGITVCDSQISPTGECIYINGGDTYFPIPGATQSSTGGTNPVSSSTGSAYSSSTGSAYSSSTASPNPSSSGGSNPDSSSTGTNPYSSTGSQSSTGSETSSSTGSHYSVAPSMFDATTLLVSAATCVFTMLAAEV